MAQHPASRAVQRDSHDLSLSPRDVTRDSLVTNMLMSLDQFSGNTGNEYSGSGNKNDNLEPSSSSWANNATYRGEHAGRDSDHQYSYSSDLDNSSKVSSQNSRGRRSNSSSNFPSNFAPMNSVRETSQRCPPSNPRSMHSRGGRGSKSSSSASVDATFPSHNHRGTRVQSASIGRSASFDHGVDGRGQYQQHDYLPSQYKQPLACPHRPAEHQMNAPTMPFQTESPGQDLTDDFEVAPTPTVHSGPRRQPSMPAMRPPPPEPTSPPAVERKRSLTSRSLKSSSGRKAQNMREAAPAIPAFDFDSAPAPNVGYGKSKEAKPEAASGGDATATAKERPGFFRRVFGSSKNTASPSPSAAHSPVSQQFPPYSDNSTRSGANKMNQTQAKPTSTSPSRDASSSHSHHPVLQKKPSSFFRRRKKSVADGAPPAADSEFAPPVPPVDPIHIQSGRDGQIDKPQPSPVSSLRKVMNPYLKNNAPATPHQHASPLADITNTVCERVDGRGPQDEYKREFSPDYDPSPNARIRTVQRDDIDDQPHVHETPTRPPPRRPDPVQKNNSFLDLDGASDNDDEISIGPDTKPARKRTERNRHTDNEETIRVKGKGRAGLPIMSTGFEDNRARSTLSRSTEGARAQSSPSTPSRVDINSTAPLPPTVRVEHSQPREPRTSKSLAHIKKGQLDEPDFVIGEPTEDDLNKARQIFDGNEDFIQKAKAASWMGEEGPVRQRTLKAYMDLYDFSGQSVISALRQVCGRLVFRAETQQVDRLLVAFSNRWCICNPNHGFKSSDVIHTTCYSIMLLNTDLHLADIEHKMTRGQFVKNTMGTITQAVEESAPDAFSRPSILPEKNNLLGPETTASQEPDRKSFRNSFRPAPRTEPQLNAQGESVEDCGPLVTAPFYGSQRAWEEQMEIVLKGIYNSIRDERLPLFGAEPESHLSTAQSQSNLSVVGMLKRSPSVLSKTPSESQISTRGRIADSSRPPASRWSSKSRSRPGLGRNGFSSSRTSFDDGSSMWSPSLSSATWSRYSLGRTHGSASQDSFGSALPRGDYQQSIGFANALSQAIIRDEDYNGNETAPSILSSEFPVSQLLEDESLELAGPPWIKEGMVVHKHHLDGVDKKARERSWSEVFAVVQKGQMSLFSFRNKASRQKSRTRAAAKVPGAPVGGGNWQDNATTVGSFNLRQTLASALPSPGYSRTRPHVWALSLPTGAVHLFQVGTPDLIKEFVTTVNYWSARLSTHPLVGGISNIEYGWSSAVVNNALVAAINESDSGQTSRPESSLATGRRSSVQSSTLRSISFDQGSGTFTHSRGKLPGDRIHIAQWNPPSQSMRPSNASESEQLEMLNAYVKSIEDDLQAHNQLRSPMQLAFTPRGHNAGKAMTNWERKSSYLLREIVKFRTYVDCLQQAEVRKKEIYAERDLAHRAARGDLNSDDDLSVTSEEEGDVTLRP